MLILCRSQQLVPLTVKYFMRQNSGVVRSLCLTSRARYDTRLLYKHQICFASPQYVPSCHGIIRFYSDRLNVEGVSKTSTSDDVHSYGEGETPLDFNIDVMVSLLRQENAMDICVIKVPEDIKYTEFFIVVSGTSTRHLRAMALYANKVYKFMKKDEDPHAKIEGKDAEDWLCIDFGRIVVHFMLPETRETYELEKLWTLRFYDEQLCSIPPETIPEDFIYGTEITR